MTQDQQIYEPDHSSHIRSAVYEPDTKLIHVQFKSGHKYTHMGVGQEVWDMFRKYHSAGSYYHKIIKRYRLKESA